MSSRARAIGLGRVVVTMTLLGTLGSVACDGEDSTGPAPVAGAYELVSINGRELPYSLSGGSEPLVVESGTIDIAEAGDYHGSLLGRSLQDFQSGSSTPQTLFEDAGITSVTGSAISFTSTLHVGLSYSATRDGDFITFPIPGSAVGSGGTLTVTFMHE